MRGILRTVGAASALSLSLMGCAGDGPAVETDSGSAAAAFRIPVTVEADQGPVTFQAEVADSPSERQRGLMYRESMDREHGMIFLFPREQQQTFWMQNTYIPLDMIFIRADRTVLGVVEEAQPRTTTRRSVPGASQFVLEINGGLARELGIGPGQAVRFAAPLPER